MRFAFTAASAGVGIGVLFSASAGFAFSVGDQTPQDYDSIEPIITEQIPEQFEEMQCGGWKDATVNGKIADVTGVPGRRTQWDGAMLSGMGTRIDGNGDGDKDNDYVWPESTAGLTTACQPGKEQIQKTVWKPVEGGRPNEISPQSVTYPHPKFIDPPCRWRIKNDDGSFSESAPDIPLKELDQYDPAIQYQELTDEPQDRQSPPVCAGFCSYLNTFQYPDCLVTADAPDPLFPLLTYKICVEWGTRFLCSDQPTKDVDFGSLCQPGAQTPIQPNSKGCAGGSCRCELSGQFQCEVVGPTNENDQDAAFYASYYRQYVGSYVRAPLEDIEGLEDKNSNTAPVACYGFYDEFDPFHKQTEAKDRRCVINIDVSGYKESQEGKGEYGQNSDLPDRDPNEDENQRAPEDEEGNDREPGDYDQETDLWYMKLSGAFSLLNEKVFEEKYEKDLTSIFLNLDELDKTKLRATEQLDEDRPLAISNNVRAFDDTGTGRVVVTWWQKQQNEMASVLHPGTVRIILPAGWSFGADPTDPFFNAPKRPVMDGFDSRGERIEVQIDADEDILGSAIGYIERSLLLNVEEEPIPVLLPMGSPTEFRALAEQWCMWYVREFNTANCDDAPDDVKDLMSRLEEYADNVDNARELRGELSRYAGKVLELQQAVTKPIGDWVKKNIDAYEAVLAEQQSIRNVLAPQWRDITEEFNKFGGDVNQPWCMNQRYTSPVYSLLDTWLPSRIVNGRITADLLPNITAGAKKDLTIDFSTIAYMTGSIALPVLKPVQVLITDLPTPPAGKEYDLPREYPELPSIENIRNYLEEATDSLPKPPANPPEPEAVDIDSMGEQKLTELVFQIANIRRVIDGMTERYDKFWKSIGPLDPDEASDDPNSIGQMKQKLECYFWDSDTCQHVEMDLMERFVRIGARPMVMLNEDYDSVGQPRGIGGPCVPSDHVCTPAYPEETGSGSQWDIRGTFEEQTKDMDELRKNIREDTLPQPIGTIPSSAFPSYETDPRYLLPIHDVPQPIDLTPRSSSSSSSQ